jgi:hypothetical protein
MDAIYAAYWPVYEKMREGKQQKERELQALLKMEKASQILKSIHGLKSLSDGPSSYRKSEKGSMTKDLGAIEEKEEDDPA